MKEFFYCKHMSLDKKFRPTRGARLPKNEELEPCTNKNEGDCANEVPAHVLKITGGKCFNCRKES